MSNENNNILDGFITSFFVSEKPGADATHPKADAKHPGADAQS